MVYRILGPEPANERDRLVEPGGPLVARHPERLLFGAVGHAQPKGRQQPPTGQYVQARQRFGQNDRVAAGHDEHARPEFQSGRAPGGKGHADNRINSRTGAPLGQPERVEAALLQRVDQRHEGIGVQAMLGP